jgi:hypothetical protein
LIERSLQVNRFIIQSDTESCAGQIHHRNFLKTEVRSYGIVGNAQDYIVQMRVFQRPENAVGKSNVFKFIQSLFQVKTTAFQYLSPT